MSVANVITRDTGRDITGLVNLAAEQYGFDPVGFLGGAIAESNLDEYSKRFGLWPDVSYGLFHVAVKWVGPEVAVFRQGDGTALDTPQNRASVRDYMWDAANAIAYTAPRYSALLKAHGDPLEAWCRWNKPNLAGEANPVRLNYVRGLAAAENYRSENEVSASVGQGIKDQMNAAGDTPITNEWVEQLGPATVAKAYGKKGLYVASPDSGQWVTTGPLPLAE